MENSHAERPESLEERVMKLVRQLPSPSAEEALLALGKDAIPYLVDSIRISFTPMIQVMAIMGILETYDRQLVLEHLMNRMLNLKQNYQPQAELHRCHLANAVAKFGDKSLAPRLIDAALDRRLFYESRVASIFALANLKCKDAFPHLLKLLEDSSLSPFQKPPYAFMESCTIGEAAIWALGMLGSKPAGKAILQVLEVYKEDAIKNQISSSNEIAKKCAFALGRLKYGSAVHALSDMLMLSGDTDLRMACMFALGEIKSKKALPVMTLVQAEVSSNRQLGEGAAKFVARFGKCKYPIPAAYLAKAFSCKDEKQRLNTVKIAIGVGEPAVAGLISVLGQEGIDAKVAYCTLEALGGIGALEAEDAIVKFIKNNSKGDAAQDAIIAGWCALVMVGHALASNGFMEILDQRDLYVLSERIFLECGKGQLLLDFLFQKLVVSEPAGRFQITRHISELMKIMDDTGVSSSPIWGMQIDLSDLGLKRGMAFPTRIAIKPELPTHSRQDNAKKAPAMAQTA